MSSPEKIEANRENAQASTGPITPEGKLNSSKNATRHGFTGQSLVLTPDEKAPYNEHVKSYFDHYHPFDTVTAHLLHQLADAHWSLHQIFVQQSNLLSLINGITTQMSAAGDALATANAIAPHAKTLSTYSIYEQRRRKIADALEARLTTLLADHVELQEKELPDAARVYKLHKAQGKPWVPADSGFVCSLADVEAFIKGQELEMQTRNFQNPVQPMDSAARRKMEAECSALLKQLADESK